MSLQIRKMSSADLPRLAEIYESNVGDALPSSGLGVVARALEGSGELAWVAVDSDARVMGYVVGEVRGWEFGSKPAGWLIGISVDPSQQRAGVGEQLVAALLGGFVARGVTTIRTMVKRDDVRVLRLFRSAGFTRGPYTELEIEMGAASQ